MKKPRFFTQFPNLRGNPELIHKTNKRLIWYHMTDAKNNKAARHQMLSVLWRTHLMQRVDRSSVRRICSADIMPRPWHVVWGNTVITSQRQRPPSRFFSYCSQLLFILFPLLMIIESACGNAVSAVKRGTPQTHCRAAGCCQQIKAKLLCEEGAWKHVWRCVTDLLQIIDVHLEMEVKFKTELLSTETVLSGEKKLLGWELTRPRLSARSSAKKGWRGNKSWPPGEDFKHLSLEQETEKDWDRDTDSGLL